MNQHNPRVVSHNPEGRAVREGERWVSEYALKFCTKTLKAVLCQGLTPEVLTELVCHDDQASVDSLIDLSI